MSKHTHVTLSKSQLPNMLNRIKAHSQGTISGMSRIRDLFNDQKREYRCLYAVIPLWKVFFYSVYQAQLWQIMIPNMFLSSIVQTNRNTLLWGCKKNLNIEKIVFKVVHMKFLAMHITNQKIVLIYDMIRYLFTVRNFPNIFMEHDLYLMS